MTKLTSQQEKFCQCIVKGMTQLDSYRVAYPKSLKWKENSVSCKASTAMVHVKIQQRIEEIRKPVIDKIQYGLEQAMAEAAEALEVSRNKEQGGAMVAAVQLRAKLNGLLIERKEIRTGALDDISHDDLVILNEALREALASGGANVTTATSSTRH